MGRTLVFRIKKLDTIPINIFIFVSRSTQADVTPDGKR